MPGAGWDATADLKESPRLYGFRLYYIIPRGRPQIQIHPGTLFRAEPLFP